MLQRWMCAMMATSLSVLVTRLRQHRCRTGRHWKDTGAIHLTETIHDEGHSMEDWVWLLHAGLQTKIANEIERTSNQYRRLNNFSLGQDTNIKSLSSWRWTCSIKTLQKRHTSRDDKICRLDAWCLIDYKRKRTGISKLLMQIIEWSR